MLLLQTQWMLGAAVHGMWDVCLWVWVCVSVWVSVWLCVSVCECAWVSVTVGMCVYTCAHAGAYTFSGKGKGYRGIMTKQLEGEKGAQYSISPFIPLLPLGNVSHITLWHFLLCSFLSLTTYCITLRRSHFNIYAARWVLSLNVGL